MQFSENLELNTVNQSAYYSYCWIFHRNSVAH